MKRRFKTRKKKKFSKIFILLLLILLIYILKIPSIKLDNSYDNIVKYILKSNITNDKGYMYNKLYSNISGKIFNDPTFILKSTLNLTENKVEDVKTINLAYSEKTMPLVYIYNSHQGETYSYEYLENYNIVPDVLMAANMLKDKLEDLNVPTLVEENDILGYMKKNNLNHAGSYIASRYFLSKVYEEYKDNIKLYIDLHRDAAPHNATYANIDGKDCAKVLFVVGLENPNYKYNLENTNKINNLIKEKYPTLTRGIMQKQGYGVNGVYNQDISKDVILMEVGGNYNNIEEINNTLDLIANIIGEYINEKK